MIVFVKDTFNRGRKPFAVRAGRAKEPNETNGPGMVRGMAYYRMVYANEASAQEGAIDKLVRHADIVHLRGQVSNALVALDLYLSRRHVDRAKAYAARTLQALRRGEDTTRLRGLLEASKKVKPDPDFEVRLPKVMILLERIESGASLDPKTVTDVKAFLMAIEEKLTLMTQEQEGLPLEPWRLGY
jgi:hypothetical protein